MHCSASAVACSCWVVTPRRGKAVEINALWYNALRLLERWTREEKGEAEAKAIADRADEAAESFNRRFWYPEGGYLYDVVDGEAHTGEIDVNELKSLIAAAEAQERPGAAR